MKKLLTGGIALFALTVAIGAAHAQEEAPGPPPGGGGGGFGGGQGGPPPGGGFGGGPGMGGPGMGGMRGGMQLSLANAPIEALTAGLNLTDDQATKIKAIQAKARPQGGRGFGGQRAQGGQGGGQDGGQGGPPPTDGQGGGGQGGGRPDFAAMRQKMQEAEKSATKDIEAVLTDEQKPMVPGVLKDIQTLRSANLPAELLGTLKLTPDQKTKLAAVGAKSQKTMQQKMQEARDSGDRSTMRQAMEDARTALDKDAAAVLTADQNAQVKKYKKDHPTPQMGGRGGFGGPGGGGFGGPGGGGGFGGGQGGPPPGGGQGGPPEK